MTSQVSVCDPISNVRLEPPPADQLAGKLQALPVAQILEDFPEPAQQLRKKVYAELAVISPERQAELRAKMKAALQDDLSSMPASSANSEVRVKIAEKLAEFDYLDQEPGTESPFERLMALLMELILLFGKLHTERHTIAARMGALSMDHAEFSGRDGVRSAQSNLYGSIAAFGIGTAVAAGGLRQMNKGTRIKINDVKTNRNEVAQLNQEHRKATHAGRKQMFADADDPQVKLKKMRAENGTEFSVEERNTLLQSDHDPVNRVLSDNLADIEHKNNLSEMARARGDQLQQSGHTLSSMVMPVSQMASSGFGVAAKTHEADAKINDVQHEVSSNMQNNESQNAQRTIDQLAKVLEIIAAIKETAHRTNNDISSAIKA